MAEAMGNGEIPADLSAILAARFRTVRKDGAALFSEKCSDRRIHSFLEQLALRVDLIPSLEQVTLVGVYPDGMMHLLHSLL